MSGEITAAKRRPARGSGLLANLALSGAALLLSLLLAELGVRLLTRTGPALIVSDPVVGKRFLAGYEGRTYVPECGCEVDLRFNRDGLRGPDRPEPRPPGTVRVALVGDSMVAAAATAEERTLARLLERKLAASQPQHAWEVMNAGVSSSSTASELLLYREVLSRYSPQLVVLVFWVGNDLADNSWALTHAPRIYFDLDAGGELVQRPFLYRPGVVSEWLNRWSRLYVWQRDAVNRALARARRGGLEPVELVFASPEPEPVAQAWAITGALLSRFRDEARSRGAELVVAVAPAPPELYDDLWAELAARAARAGQPLERRHPEERMRELCRQTELPCLLLDGAFRAATPHRDSARLDERLFYAGRFHWNDAGNALAAASIHGFLAARLAAGSSRPAPALE